MPVSDKARLIATGAEHSEGGLFLCYWRPLRQHSVTGVKYKSETAKNIEAVFSIHCVLCGCGNLNSNKLWYSRDGHPG